MRGYTEITTQAQLDAFVERIDALCDSFLKEARLLNISHIKPTTFDGRVREVGFTTQLVFQGHPQDIEIVLCGVEAFDSFCYVLEDGIGTWTITETDKWPRRRIEMGDLVASRFFYRFNPKSESKATLGPELPEPDAPPATIIEPGWRMCQHCINAWREDESIVFARCPKCGNVTELAEE